MYKDIIHENHNWQMPVLRDMLKISPPFAIIKKTKELRNAVFCMCRDECPGSSALDIERKGDRISWNF